MVSRGAHREGAMQIEVSSNRGVEPMRITLLGTFQVSIGSRTVGEDEWPLRKSAAVVKLLALAPNHRLHCEQLMHLLWPRLGPEAAANNLRRALHCARQTLEPDPETAACYLGRRTRQLVLCPEASFWVDVDAFEEAAVTASRTKEPAAFWFALDLYSEDLLPADRYEEWAETRRAHLREAYLALLAEVAVLHEERGESGPRIEAVRRMPLVRSAYGESHAKTTGSYASPTDKPSGRLTRRQQHIAILVARGLTNRQIAERLGVAERTVDAHLRKVFAKLDLHSRVQLATWVSEHGLLLQDTSRGSPTARTLVLGQER
jgi:DNA-binding CsgD family transcriptional regulator